jgi:hypothetical protein
MKKLTANFPLPKEDPFKVFAKYPGDSGPTIPFGHYRVQRTYYEQGCTIDVLEFKRDEYRQIESILRITANGIIYHLTSLSQWGREMLYSLYFCRDSVLPYQLRVDYTDTHPKEPFDVNLRGEKFEIAHEYRNDHQPNLPTRDSDVGAFFQEILNVAKNFYLNHRAELL